MIGRTRFHGSGRSSRRGAAALITIGALALAPVAACGSDAATPPTAGELAARLMTVEDLDGAWTVNRGPDGTDDGTGVVTDEMRAQLPRLDLCDAAGAAAQEAEQGLGWMAFRQLDRTVDDPIEPPDDRTGHMTFVQEFMTAGEPAEIESTFELLREGVEACLGDIPAGEEGPGRSDSMTMPDIGDDRFGVRLVMDEAGGWAQWHMWSGFVREGAVLMDVVIVDITAGVDVTYTDEEIGEIITVALDRR